MAWNVNTQVSKQCYNSKSKYQCGELGDSRYICVSGSFSFFAFNQFARSCKIIFPNRIIIGVLAYDWKVSKELWDNGITSSFHYHLFVYVNKES